MHDAILWAGFLGAWLLVAGPVFQASIELAEEEFERENYQDAISTIGRPGRVSPWWWLLPPVHLYLSNRIKGTWWREFVVQLDDQQYEQFHSYRSKAGGWIMVAAGGLLIAAKETWELVEGNEWPTWLFWVLLVVALVVALGHTVLRSRGGGRVSEERRTARAAQAAD